MKPLRNRPHKYRQGESSAKCRRCGLSQINSIHYGGQKLEQEVEESLQTDEEILNEVLDEATSERVVIEELIAGVGKDTVRKDNDPWRFLQ